MFRKFSLSLSIVFCLQIAQAQELVPLEVTKVSEQVYSAIGARAPATYANGGHNNNLSFIITSQGVVVVNGGASYRLAKRLHLAIKMLTGLPVLWLLNENGQGHAFLGNSYWRDQGVKLMAHKDAVADMRQHGEQILSRMKKLNQEKAKGTYLAIPEHELEDFSELLVGQTIIQIRSFGTAHSPGDISVW